MRLRSPDRFDPCRRAIGLVHAGRVGTRNNVSGAAVAALERVHGCAPPDIHAFIGPCAGPARYEVSVELAQDWRTAGLPATGRYLDLWQANAEQLIASGVPAGQVHVCGLCTISCDRFFSHRRQPDGRNMALLML